MRKIAVSLRAFAFTVATVGGALALAACAGEVDDLAESENDVVLGTRHLVFGTPRDGTSADDLVLVRDQFALSYNKFRGGPNWVSWVTTRANFGAVPRREDFLTDPLLPKEIYRVTQGDYTGFPWTRGHVLRSEERTNTVADNDATFVMSNVLPQADTMNRGPWYRFERYCERLVRKEARDVYVVSGGIFADACATDVGPDGNYPSPECLTIGRSPLPERRIAVPDKFFKLAVVLPPGRRLSAIDEETRIVSVVMDNVDGPTTYAAPWKETLTSVDAIEAMTGYDFLDKFPDELEILLESKVDTVAATAIEAQ